MASREKTRLLVFSAFLFALILFAMLYRPVDAMSRPVSPENTAGVIR